MHLGMAQGKDLIQEIRKLEEKILKLTKCIQKILVNLYPSI